MQHRLGEAQETTGSLQSELRRLQFEQVLAFHWRLIRSCCVRTQAELQRQLEEARNREEELSQHVVHLCQQHMTETGVV